MYVHIVFNGLPNIARGVLSFSIEEERDGEWIQAFFTGGNPNYNKFEMIRPSYIDLNNLYLSQTFTVSLWVKHTLTDPIDWERIIAFTDSTNGRDQALTIEHPAGNSKQCYRIQYRSTSGDKTSSIFELVQGKLNHILITGKSNKFKCYLNCVEVYSANDTFDPPANNKVYVQSNLCKSEYDHDESVFEGSISSFYVWDKYYEPGDVENLYSKSSIVPIRKYSSYTKLYWL